MRVYTLGVVNVLKIHFEISELFTMYSVYIAPKNGN